MSNLKKDVQHTMRLEDRKFLVITGVNKVKSFDPKEISLETVKGSLIIKGHDLGVKNLDLEASELEIEGNIDLMTYATGRAGSVSSKGVWEKLFK